MSALRFGLHLKFDNETLEFAFGFALGEVAQIVVLRSVLDEPASIIIKNFINFLSRVIISKQMVLHLN